MWFCHGGNLPVLILYDMKLKVKWLNPMCFFYILKETQNISFIFTKFATGEEKSDMVYKLSPISLTSLISFYLPQNTLLTNDLDMFDDIISHVGHIPHHQEWGEAVDIFIVTPDVGFVREWEIVSNGCQEHLYTDQEIL